MFYYKLTLSQMITSSSLFQTLVNYQPSYIVGSLRKLNLRPNRNLPKTLFLASGYLFKTAELPGIIDQTIKLNYHVSGIFDSIYTTCMASW